MEGGTGAGVGCGYGSGMSGGDGSGMEGGSGKAGGTGCVPMESIYPRRRTGQPARSARAPSGNPSVVTGRERGERMIDVLRPPDPPDPKPDDEEAEEAVEETFPSSDPPAHGNPGI
jgi:hypothetical protein